MAGMSNTIDKTIECQYLYYLLFSTVDLDGVLALFDMLLKFVQLLDL